MISADWTKRVLTGFLYAVQRELMPRQFFRWGVRFFFFLPFLSELDTFLCSLTGLSYNMKQTKSYMFLSAQLCLVLKDVTVFFFVNVLTQFSILPTDGRNHQYCFWVSDIFSHDLLVVVGSTISISCALVVSYMVSEHKLLPKHLNAFLSCACCWRSSA